MPNLSDLGTDQPASTSSTTGLSEHAKRVKRVVNNDDLLESLLKLSDLIDETSWRIQRNSDNKMRFSMLWIDAIKLQERLRREDTELLEQLHQFTNNVSGSEVYDEISEQPAAFNSAGKAVRNIAKYQLEIPADTLESMEIELDDDES